MGNNGNEAPGPDLTPPDEPAIEPATELDGENLAGVLAAVFDKAKKLGVDPDPGFERAALYLSNLGGWNRNRNANLFAILEKARAAGDHLAMLDAAHEIAESEKGKAGAAGMVWEAIAPLLKKVFLGALK